MPDYRLYELDETGRILAAAWLSAEDDDAAVRAAEARRRPGIAALEVWLGSRRLAVLDGGGADEAPEARPPP